MPCLVRFRRRLQHIIEMFLNNIVMFYLVRFTIIFKDPRTTTRIIFSLVERLLDSEQESYHKCEGRSFASKFFASTILVVTEGINTLEFLVDTIITCKKKIKCLYQKVIKTVK